jgi:hypothetical protein
MVNMRNALVARRAEEVQPVRNWSAFVVPNGQVVYRERYYFAWNQGHFIGAYDRLDDAVESLTFRNKKNTLNADPVRDRASNGGDLIRCPRSTGVRGKAQGRSTRTLIGDLSVESDDQCYGAHSGRRRQTNRHLRYMEGSPRERTSEAITRR